MLAACGTDAVGVSECREIEQARCAAAAACGFPNVAECQRFYRDHCLHGLSGVRDILSADGCVADLGRLGRCAAELGATASVSACSEPVATAAGNEAVCDVVRRPELASSCAFLAEPVPEPPPAPPAADAGGS